MRTGSLSLFLLALMAVSCSSVDQSSDPNGAGENTEPPMSVAGEQPMQSPPGDVGMIQDDDMQASGGGTASGGFTATGGSESATTGGESPGSGGDSPGTGGTLPVCDPSGDSLTSLANDDHTVFQSTGFEDGSVDPFVICTTQSPNYGRGTSFDGRNVLEFHWEEEGYNGSRMRKGAEACGGPRFHKEGWYGFQFYLPDPGFPKDKTQGIAQIFGLGGCSSWVSKLRIDDNDVVFSRRGHCGTAEEALIAEDVERNVWHTVVIHFVISHNEEGLTEVWFDEDACDQATPTYRAEGINYGFGGYEDDNGDSHSGWDAETDSLTRFPIDPDSQGGFREFFTNEIEFKIGMYTFDDENYTPGETRTLYYDNVSMLAEEGETGFMKVNPAFGEQP